MIVVIEAVLALLAGAGALYLVLRPLFGGSAAQQPIYEPPELLETRKGRALSALREIEFDRATGKLSDDDYTDLKAKYTAEAVAVLRGESAAGPEQPDADDSLPADDEIEAMISARREHLSSAIPAKNCAECGPRPEHDALFCSKCGRRLAETSCAQCGSALEPDANYCGSCGAAAGSDAVAAVG